ncbi:MAG: hypothetical protein KDN19_14680 [Verrucomicrobiae bacterium]|nr:hypothetical protein [Verrucomicrobiae bacterium]
MKHGGRHFEFGRLVAVVVWLGGALSLSAGPFGEDSIFEKLTGDWEARGKLTNNDGSITEVRETWTGKRESDTAFEASGTRVFDEQDPHTFTWRYLYNPTTELIECEMTMSTQDQPIRFEVQVSDAAGTVSMKAPLDADGSELRIINEIKDDKIVGTVTITDANGNQTVSGTVEHRRPGGWETRE